MRAKALKFMGKKDFEANLRAMMTPVKGKKNKKHRTPGTPVVAQPDNKLNGMKGTTNSGGQREGKKKPSLSAKEGAESPLVKSWADLVDTGGNDTASDSISEDEEKPSEEQMKLQPLALLSGVFTGHSENWSVLEKECYKQHVSVTKLEHLVVREKPLQLWTDSKTLIYLLAPLGRPAGLGKAQLGKLERWSLCLRDLHYECHHISGEENTWSDMLSRMHPPDAALVRAKKVTVRLPHGSGPVVGDSRDTGGSATTGVWPTVQEIREKQDEHLRLHADPLEGPTGDGKPIHLDGDLWCTAKGQIWIPAAPYDQATKDNGNGFVDTDVVVDTNVEDTDAPSGLAWTNALMSPWPY
jgi:hypothetical protein